MITPEKKAETGFRRISASVQLTKKAENHYVPHRSKRDPLILEGISLYETLGEGRFTRIRRGYWKKHRREVAVKIIYKKEQNRKYCEYFLPREVATLRKTEQHPLIVDFFAALETAHAYFLVLELCSNGDLLDYVNKHEFLPEVEARYFFRQLVDAVQYLHFIGIAHRDIKLDNILLDEHYQIRLTDFGFANFHKDQLSTTNCGSFVYAAPELFAGRPYNAPRVDIWSLGVCLYAMLCGRLPFVETEADCSDIHVILHKVREKLHFSKPVASICRQLIRTILQLEPERRPNLTQINLHQWMSQPMHVDLCEVRTACSYTNSGTPRNTGPLSSQYCDDGGDDGRKMVSDVLTALAQYKTAGLQTAEIRRVRADSVTGVSGPAGRRIKQQLLDQLVGPTACCDRQKDRLLQEVDSRQVTLSSEQLLHKTSSKQHQQTAHELKLLKHCHAGLMARAARTRTRAELSRKSARYTAVKLRWKAALLALKRTRYSSWRQLCRQLSSVPCMDIEERQLELEMQERFDFSQF